MTSRLHQRSPLALTVLALLSEAPMHAYRMHDLIKRRGKDTVVNVAQRNSVYQTIERLLRAELIRVQQTLQDEGRPERVVYELTEEGSATLVLWLKEMLTMSAREYPEFPAALAFLPVLSAKDALHQLELRAELLRVQIKNSQTASRQMLASGLPALFLLEDDYKQAMLKSELAWVDRLVGDLKSKAITWSPRWLRKVAADFEG